MTGDPHVESHAGSPQPIMLRRSTALRVAMAAFALLVSCAVCGAAAPHCGILQAVGFAVATLAILMLGMLAYERRQPFVLKIGPDGVAAFSRAGEALLAGHIVGFSQWPHLFLVMAIAGCDGKGRVHPLLIPADSLSPDSFRELAVKARRGAR
ncbi:hypothetical protein FAZ69_22895 [Trinickia terrae]|uniref:Lipoprotein n=1 Tax=Trinickia terrae TaxID=2571161 RepID=A0A4U1HUN4_9BURK|nr:hypothetical protein [Trinickia terrae]TKC83878.1 hypothetical protein FAZ69_22895 [Trinickia terrae]